MTKTESIANEIIILINKHNLKIEEIKEVIENIDRLINFTISNLEIPIWHKIDNNTYDV